MARSLDEILEVPVEHPRLVIEPAVWRQIIAWATVTNSEVSGMGMLEPEGDDAVRLTRVFLVPQTGNAMATQLDPEGMADLMAQLLDEDQDPGALRVWWHSHGREAPFWSGQDEHTIEGFAPVPMVSVVVDHQQRRLARLDRYSPRDDRWMEIAGADPVGDWTDEELERARDEVSAVVGSLPREARFRPGTGSMTI
jgi:hypothetical protein